MKKYIIIITLLISTLLLTLFLSNYKENNKEISKVKRLLSKPEGIQAYTLNGQKTNKEFSDLINNYVLDKITCKNGSIATYNKATNEVSLSNIHMPDYCTMNFRYTIYGRLLADNPTISERTDFSTTFTTTNTGTLYKSTESIAGSTPKDVYYFAGDAKNNWVKFAGFYWRIIRTNHDGSVRLLYSGTSPDTTEGYIGTSAFNTEFNSPKYVGYMYGEDDSSLDGIRTNTKDSTIKTFIDNWYSNNLTDYSRYLSKDAVYCSDRNIGDGSYITNGIFRFNSYTRLNTENQPTYNCSNIKDAFSGSNTVAKLIYPVGLMTSDEIAYAGGYRYTPLSSPYAWYFTNSEGISITGSVYWATISPDTWYETTGYVWGIGTMERSAEIYGQIINYSYFGIRPVISIKGNLTWKSGDGSSANPYEVEELALATIYEQILADNPKVETRTDFSTVYTETNTGTLFKTTETVAGSTAKDVYYFAGDAKNNWVKFGGFYWRTIRTNHDGSVRLLYSGTSPDTTEGYIGTSAFNTEFNSPKYVGYMYGEDDSSLDGIRTNTKDSTIKTFIDNWYSNNLNNYTKYISKDAVYCNDRNTADYNTSGTFYFSLYENLVQGTQTYNCINIKDAFSGNNLNAKLTYPISLMTANEIMLAGSYLYQNLSNSMTWYYNNSEGASIIKTKDWWLLSPGFFKESKYARVWIIGGSYYPGRLFDDNVFLSKAIRPVISIKGNLIWKSGNGSPKTPYEIVYN